MERTARRSLAVVIPAWNAERYLAEAIESVLGQTVPVDTILVVDDGSTDDTAAVARRYPEVRLVQQANAGAGAARNRGVAATDEALLAFLDADDVWLPHKLERQLPHVEERGFGAVFGLVQNFVSPDVADALADLEFERRPLPRLRAQRARAAAGGVGAGGPVRHGRPAHGLGRLVLAAGRPRHRRCDGR